jgi:hypothetical protein
MNDLEKFKSLINENTKLVWVETPTNPLMKLADIQEIAKITKQHKILFAVDNTFATPYLQKPLDLGADIVMHSATKYLGGHSDVIAGALIIKDEEENAFDSDVETDKSNFRAVAAEYFMFWNCQFNGRKKLDDPTKRKDRKAYPVKEQILSCFELAEPKGGTVSYCKGLICKSHSDQHTDKPAGKDQKPVYITPLNVSPNYLQLMRGGEVVAKSAKKEPYNEKINGVVGKQIGWRYYFPKWGYQMGNEILELWGQGKLATVNPTFRDFLFR